MKLHGNARLTPHGRTLMCQRVRHDGWTIAEAAAAAGCSERTCYRWLVRFDAGEPLEDRSSAPHSVPGRTPPETEALIEQLRRLRFTSTRIAAELDLPTSTVCAGAAPHRPTPTLTARTAGAPEPLLPAPPGELIHIDIKKLGRFARPGMPAHQRSAGYKPSYRAGWDVVHVAVDDTSRLAYVEILDDEKATTCVAFLRRAIDWFAGHGITVERVMTDNGPGYKSKIHAEAIAELEIKHLRNKPYRPRTNGKAERFIKTLQVEWDYAASYQTSQHRAEVLPTWLSYYNNKRPHSALAHKPPITHTKRTD